MLISNISVVILAAGKSERFGRPKAFLKFSKSQVFLEKLLQNYSGIKLNKIVIVINEQILEETEKIIARETTTTDIHIIINKNPGSGRFISIRLGADAIEKDSAAFIQNVDNPFVTNMLLEEMSVKLRKGTYVAPVCSGKNGHPVLLSSEILSCIRNITDANANLRDVLKNFEELKLFTSDERIHANINTQQEYQNYFQ